MSQRREPEKPWFNLTDTVANVTINKTLSTMYISCGDENRTEDWCCMGVS
jgi:hypothetical protein